METKHTTEMLHFSHSVEIRSQFFNGRFQVVNSFQAILEETEQKQTLRMVEGRIAKKTNYNNFWCIKAA